MSNIPQGVERIIHNKKLVATVVRSSFVPDNSNGGIHFFSKDKDPLQVGMISKKAGDIAKPHVHVCKPLTIKEVQEIIFVESGKVKFTMYDGETNIEIASVVLQTGDKIFHVGEGHGVEYLEDSVLFEVKQGPYDEKKNYKKFLD